MPTTVVIGAGISGLQCASAFLRLGHTVTILERDEDVGGVWLRYTAFNLQVPREFFCFPDFACPPELEPEEYPTGRSLLRYIIAYAHKNQLYRHIIFRATVTRLHRLSGQWQCFYDVRTDGSGGPRTQGGSGGGGGGGYVVQQHRITADFLVVATGLHSSPYVPMIDGHHLFRGRVLHVQDLPSSDGELSELVAGRRVLLIGGTKTAVDTATRLAAAGADETLVVYRQAHWPISRYPLRGVHFTRLLHSRLAAAMLDPYYNTGLLGRAKGWVTRPLRRLFWRTLERSLIRQQHLSGEMLPSLPLDKDLLTGGLVHDGKWLQSLQDGAVRAVRGEPLRFTSDGLILRTGECISTDLVVMATGYIKDYSFIDADILSKLGVQRDGLYLYRHVLPPLVRNIAFVGAANSLNNPLTSYLQAKWLVACLQERVRLPDPHDMLRDLQRQTRWQRKKLPPQADRASMIGIYSHHYHDCLLADMGIRTRRKKNLWRECFEPYTAADFQDLTEDTEGERRWQSAAAAGAPLAPAMSLVPGSSFKLSATTSAVAASDMYDVTATEHSVGFGFIPSMRQSAAAAVAATGGSADGGEVCAAAAAAAEQYHASFSGYVVKDTTGPASSFGAGTAGPPGPVTAPPMLAPSNSYGSRSGGGMRSLGTLYEQEGGRWGLNGRASSMPRSGPGPTVGRLVGVSPNSAQTMTPPDTPTPSMSPNLYGPGFRPVGRLAVYVPPSSGRSCLMDAAALALMDGIVGGALLEEPPKLASPTATVAAASSTVTDQLKSRTISASGDPRMATAVAAAAIPPAATESPVRKAAAAQLARGMAQSSARAHTAPAATAAAVARRSIDVRAADGSGGGEPAAAVAAAATGLDNDSGGASSSSSAALYRGRCSPTKDLGVTVNGMLETDSDSSSALLAAARVVPLGIEVGAASSGGSSADGSNIRTLPGPHGISSPFPAPVLAALTSASALTAPSGSRTKTLEVSSEEADGRSGGGGCGGGEKHDAVQTAVWESSTTTPARNPLALGARALPAAGSAATAVAAAAATEPHGTSSPITQRHGSSSSAAKEEIPTSSSKSNVGAFNVRTSPPYSKDRAAVGGGVGKVTASTSSSLVRLVTTRQQAAAATADAAAATAGDAAADSDILAPSTSGSANAGTVRPGSSTATAALLRAVRRASDFFDESDDFVGTPPSCFEGSMEALAMDQGAGNREPVSSQSPGAIRQRRAIHGFSYRGDDTDEYDDDEYDNDEGYGCLPRGLGPKDGDSSESLTLQAGMCCTPVPMAVGGKSCSTAANVLRPTSDDDECSSGDHQGPSSAPMTRALKHGGADNGDGSGGCGDQAALTAPGVTAEARTGGARPYKPIFTLQPSASFGRGASTANPARAISPHAADCSYRSSVSSRRAAAAAAAAVAAAGASSGNGNHRDGNPNRSSVDSAADTARRLATGGHSRPYGATGVAAVVSGSGGGSGGGGGGAGSGSVSSALERYAARMTAAPTFRMSMTNMADMKPENIKQAARASAAAAAMAAAMAAANGGGGGVSMHSAPLHHIFLHPGGGGVGGGGHSSYNTTSLHPYQMATSRLAPIRPTRVSEGTENDSEVPPEVVLGGPSQGSGGCGGSSWEADDGGGGVSMSALMVVGDDDGNGEPGGAAANQSSASNAISLAGAAGGGGGSGGNAATVASCRASTSVGYGCTAPGMTSPAASCAPSGRSATAAVAGASPLPPSAFCHTSAAHAMYGADGFASSSPPGGCFAAAATASGNWDMTLKQLSQAVVAPSQRAGGGLRAAMISRRNLLSVDRPSESGFATPTSGSFFNARRAVGDDGGGGSGGGGGSSSGLAAAAAAAAASGSGSGSGIQLMSALLGSGGGSGGGGGTGSGGGGGVTGVLIGGNGPVVQLSGPAMTPVRDLNASSRFLTGPSSSSAKNNRMQPRGASAFATATAVAAATAAAAEHGGGGSSSGARHQPGSSITTATTTTAVNAAAGSAAAGGGADAAAAAGNGSFRGDAVPDGGGNSGSASASGGTDVSRAGMHWSAAVAAAKELRLQSEGARSAFASLLMAARARRSRTTYGATAAAPASQKSPILAKLIAASQSHNGAVQSGDNDHVQHLSSARAVGGGGAGPAAAAIGPASPDGVHVSNPARRRSRDEGGAAPAALLPAAAAVAAAGRGALYGSGGGSDRRSSWESSGGGSGGGGNNGGVAKSFKRLGGLLMPSSPPMASIVAPKFNAGAEDGDGGGGGGGSIRLTNGSSDGGAGIMPSRLLRRMRSSKRRSAEGMCTTGGITTVEEDLEVMALPPPQPPAAAAAVVAQVGGGGGGGSSTVIVTPLESPPAALADALFGRTMSRRSVILYNPAAMPLDLYSSAPPASAGSPSG